MTKKIDDAMASLGWIPIRQAAKKTGKHYTTLYRHVKAGTLRSQPSGGRTYVAVADLVASLGEAVARELGLLPPPVTESSVRDETTSARRKAQKRAAES